MSTLVLRAADPRPWVCEFLATTFPEQIAFHPGFSLQTFCTWKNLVTLPPIQKNNDNDDSGEEQVKKNKSTLIARQVNIVGTVPPYDKPFVAIPLLIKGRNSCTSIEKEMIKNKNTSKIPLDPHDYGAVLLWNRITNKGYIFDPLFYYSNGDFSIGSMVKLLRSRIKRQLNCTGLFAITFSKSLVIHMQKWISNKLSVHISDIPARLWYTLLCLWQIYDMVHNPEVGQKSIVTNVMLKHTPEEVDAILTKMQDKFEKFYATHVVPKNRCTHRRKTQTDSGLLNPETGICVNPNGKVGLALKGIEPKRIPRAQKQWAFVKPKTVASTITATNTFIPKIYDEGEVVVRYLTKRYPHAAVFSNKENTMLNWSWDEEKKKGTLFIPAGFQAFWEKSLTNPAIHQIVCLLSLEAEMIEEAHANVLIFNKKTDELEIFEPQGAGYLSFGSDFLYQELESYMKKIASFKKLTTPTESCPKKMDVFQSAEGNEGMLWETSGYCAVWTLWYIENRLANPQLKTKDCVKLAMNRLMDLGSLRNFIWNYDRYVKSQIINSKNNNKN